MPPHAEADSEGRVERPVDGLTYGTRSATQLLDHFPSHGGDPKVPPTNNKDPEEVEEEHK